MSDDKPEPKIKLYYMSTNEQILVWNSNDVLKLRQQHRIVGCLIGPYTGGVYQINKNGLPLLLMKEEARLLIDKEICDLIEVEDNYDQSVIDSYQNHLKETQEEYKILATKRRAKEISEHKARVKRKKTEDEDDNQVTDQAINEQTVAIETMNNDLLPVQLFTECPWTRTIGVINSSWSYPQSDREKAMFAIFSDLWDRGHYITNGFKFGCDYLVYEYDPQATHATYMVICKPSDDDLTSLQIIILSRISTQVNKQLKIASIISDKGINNEDLVNYDTKSSDNIERNNVKPVYLSFKWQGNQDSPFKRYNKISSSWLPF